MDNKLRELEKLFAQGDLNAGVQLQREGCRLGKHRYSEWMYIGGTHLEWMKTVARDLFPKHTIYSEGIYIRTCFWCDARDKRLLVKVDRGEYLYYEIRSTGELVHHKNFDIYNHLDT